MTLGLPPRLRLLITAAVALAVVLPAGLVAPGTRPRPDRPTVMALPDNWLPEGIATVGSTAYLGSRADGDILRLDLRTGEYEVFSQGPGKPGGRHRSRARPAPGGGRPDRQRPGRRPAQRRDPGDVRVHHRPVVRQRRRPPGRDRLVHRLPPAAAVRRLPPRRLGHDAATVRCVGAEPWVQRQRHRDHAGPQRPARHQLLQRHAVPRRPGDRLRHGRRHRRRRPDSR